MRRSKRWAAVVFSMALVAAVAVPGGVDVRAEEFPGIGEKGLAQPMNEESNSTPVEEQKKPEGEKPAPNVKVTTKDSQVYEFKNGQDREAVGIEIQITNVGNVDLTNVVVAPVLDTDVQQWPFTIDKQSDGYEEVIENLPIGETRSVTYSVTAREDAAPAWYNTVFHVGSAEGLDAKGEIYFLVKEPEQDLNAEQEQTEEEMGTSGFSGGMEDFGGGVSNGDVTSNGKKTDNTSVPRVIVSGFTTDPQEVTAGSNFRLVIHVQNTSKKIAVSNLLFDLQAPTDGKDADTAAAAFLPASGSSSIYLEKIPAGETRDIAIELNARADLLQKPYSVALTMKYEDGDGTQYEGASSVSVPVKQAARFEFSEFEINPEAISVGEEGNVTCSLYNLGRTKLYNVKAKFEGMGIKGKEVFVGNVDSGATASIDGMITGEEETAPDNKVKMTVTYEDEGGALSSVEKEFTLPVIQAAPMDEMTMMPEMQAEKKFPVIQVVIGVVVVAGIIAGVVIYKKKKKKALQNEEDELADEIDRPSEDE